MKRTITIFTLCILPIISFTQNKGIILGSQYAILPGTTPQPLPVSTLATNIDSNNPLDGYDGDPAKLSQNIQINDEEEIIFFIVDNIVFDRNGAVIDVMNAFSTLYHTNYANGVLGEHTVVPDPGDCNSYYILSSAAANPSVAGSFPFFYKLKVYIDAAGNLMPGSGFESFDPSIPCAAKWKFIKDVIGADYDESDIPQTQDPMYGVIPNSSGYFLFLKTGSRLFRLKIDDLGVHYESYLDLQSIYSDLDPGSWAPKVTPQELEVIQLSSGNYRIAFAGRLLFSTNVNFPSGNYEGVLVADLDINGNLIANTLKYARYKILSDVTEPLKFSIRGVELSPNGNRLYVSHTQYGMHTSSFDVFDLTIADPNSGMTVISSSTDYNYSQIEATFSDRVLIPHSTGIAAVNNSNSPTFPFDFDVNYIGLGSYPLATGEFGNEIEFVRLLQDQIDGYDYSSIEYLEYGADIYTVTGNEIWSPNSGGGSNPIISGPGNIAYIKSEIRIEPGASLTINNIEIRFSPGARVVIENSTGISPGASLYMNNTVFTNESRCTKDELWVGVEVWGNQTLTQNGGQGSLVMNNSSIKNAWVGVLLGARSVTYVSTNTWPGDCNFSPLEPDLIQVVELYNYNNAQNGGLVLATNSSFYNNQIGVYFRPYFAPGGLNNLSKFQNSSFIWDGILKETAPLRALAKLEEVKGVGFKGCDFENLTPNLYTDFLQGFGIQASESQFYVLPKCNVAIPFGTPCPSETKSKFQGLLCGVLALNANALSFKCHKAEFKNCLYGIVTFGTDLEKITQNEFQVRESSVLQSAGLFMINSTGYKVQENNFTNFDDPVIPLSAAESYGIVVRNSGPYDNKIYKNNFSNLKIGGQTELVNATTSGLNGLFWQCNDFIANIDEHDLTLMNGSIRNEQGNPILSSSSLLLITKAAANNKFSLSGENDAIDHDLYVSTGSENYEYIHISAPRHVPDSYTEASLGVSSYVDLNALSYNLNPISNDAGACPSLIGEKPISAFKSELNAFDNLILNLENPLILGSSDVLIDAITNENPEVVKNLLLSVSPYLSDNVMIAYVESNPPSGYLKQVLIANSKLSEAVQQSILNINLPNGTVNQIASVQTGTSQRDIQESELNYYVSERNLLYWEMLSELLLDQDSTANFTNLIDELTNKEDLESLVLLFKVYLHNKDLVNADQILQKIILLDPSSELIQFAEIQKEINYYSSSCVAIESDSVLMLSLESLQNNLNDSRISVKAECLLSLHITPQIPLFLVDYASIQQNISNESIASINLRKQYSVSMYPNPSSGLVTFDFPLNESGELTIEVVDLTGKLMHVESWSETNGQQIDLSLLRKGLYLVRISIDNDVIETQSLKLQ